MVNFVFVSVIRVNSQLLQRIRSQMGELLLALAINYWSVLAWLDLDLLEETVTGMLVLMGFTKNISCCWCILNSSMLTAFFAGVVFSAVAFPILPNSNLTTFFAGDRRKFIEDDPKVGGLGCHYTRYLCFDSGYLE
ncbi:hypothetical protein Dimus_005356 [Dionaea muscipula]